MKKFVVSLMIAASSVAYADCQLPENLVVSGDTEQYRQLCTAYQTAERFFTEHGFNVNTSKVKGKVYFEKEVKIPVTDSLGNSTFIGGTRVLGMFDRSSGELRITDEKDPWIKHPGRTYFKLQYTPELYHSVLVHELVHLLSKQFYQYQDYGHAQEEYIAYAAQIWSMDEKTRQSVLNRCKNCQFTNKYNINDIIHFSGPHEFGVMSWNHFSGPEGGTNFLNRIYTGDFKPINLSDL